MIPVVVIGASLLTIWAIYDIHKNSDSLQYVYLPAPTIGSVRPPPLSQIGPITNNVGSPWLGGNSSYVTAWSYDMNS